MIDERVIPVRLGSPRLGKGSDFVDRPPVTFVHVTSDPEWRDQSGQVPRHSDITYRALLDTGAESTSIDVQVADEMGIKATESATVHGLDATREVGAVNVQIILPVPNIVFPDRAAITSLTDAGQTFHVILGRSFLKHCRFSIDGPTAGYSLCWVR